MRAFAFWSTPCKYTLPALPHITLASCTASGSTEGRDADDVRDEIARILRESPHPNVTVDCPDCGGTGTTYVPEYSAGRNAACGGSGKVASAEEWAVHDYDDVFGDTWGEHPDLDKLCALQERLDELHNDTERAAYTAFCDHEGLDDVTVEQFHEAYAGQFDSWADFAENYVDESRLLHDVPDALSATSTTRAMAATFGSTVTRLR